MTHKQENSDLINTSSGRMASVQKVIMTSKRVRDRRYAGSIVAFAAGSFIRGEATSHSDIDLVVVYERLPNAYRESFVFEGFPVEAFVHDPETLRYFIDKVDCASGIPSLPQMIKEGVVIPAPNSLSESLKEFAEEVLKAGPPELTEADRKNKRYSITDLVDDLRAPRSFDELPATGVRLYETLGDYYLRANGYWSATGKAIPRALKNADPALFERYNSIFQQLFRTADTQPVIELAAEILAPDGGFIFDGYRLDAPPDWRKS